MLDRPRHRVSHTLGWLTGAARPRGEPGLLNHHLVKLTLRRYRIDDGDVDTAPYQLGTQAFRQSHLCEFGCRICADVRYATLANDRRDDDEVTVMLAPKDRQRRSCGVEGAEIVHLHHRLHFFRRNLVDGAVDAVAGVANEDIDLAPARDRLVHERLHVGGFGDVGDEREGCSAGLNDLGGDAVQAITPPRANRHRCTVTRQANRNRASDPRRRARDCDDPPHRASSAMLRRTKPTLAGRSPSRRMKYGNHW